MISWIRGEIIDTWLQNKKLYVLISCNGIGLEVQVLDSLKRYLDKSSITLWVEQIKREDTDLFFGFKDKLERDFFRDLLKVKGIGPQISMSLLNKKKLSEIIYSIKIQDKKLFSLVPGIGPKMTDRILFELKNKILSTYNIDSNISQDSKHTDSNKEFKNLIDDIDLALKSLAYSLKERKKAKSFILEKINNQNNSEEDKRNNILFENALKDILEYLDKE